MKKQKKEVYTAVAAALGLAGCAYIPSVGPDYAEPDY